MDKTKSLLWSILLWAATSLSAQSASPITLRCEFQGCPESPALFEFDGATFSPLQQAKKIEEGVYEFSIPASGHRFYYVGTNTQNMRPVILGGEPTVVLQSHCQNIRGADVARSDINIAYEGVKVRMNELLQEANKLGRLYNVSFGEKREEVSQQLQAVDKQKKKLLDSMLREEPYLGKIIALNTYLSYQNNPGAYENEIEYFAGEFFRFADFKDPAYQNMPWVYEAFRNYTTTLLSARLSEEQQKAYLEAALNKIPEGSNALKLALGGALNILKAKSNSNFVYFGEMFVASFEKTDPNAAASMAQQLEQMRQFVVGGMAPDFTQKTPEGEDLSLSDLRGKVVLIDFWASWCGPCRRENPNVLAMYNKYKDKGFEIIGVSLDKTRDRWTAAIEQDGLSWHHVSDLQGWKNEVAATYGVRSIPHTVLLDPEGRIVARNLRGATLERKVAELLE